MLGGFLVGILVSQQQTPGVVCGVSQDQRTIVCYPANVSVKPASAGAVG